MKLYDFFLLENLEAFRTAKGDFGIFSDFCTFFWVAKNLIYIDNAFNGYSYLKSTRVRPECAPGQFWAPHCPHEIPRRPAPRNELSGPPRMRAWSILGSSLPSQDAALPPNTPFLRRTISEELLSDWALPGYARRPAPRRE